MQMCHTCGKNFPDHAGVVRSIKTGMYSGGADYFRSVYLCDHCDAERSRLSRAQNLNKVLLLVGSVVALLGTSAYMWFFR